MDDSEDDPFCRVCHGPAEDDQPLYHPCRCDGSIKWVHQECLTDWLKMKGGSENRCELCREAFIFTPLYSEDAPERLSPWEFGIGLASQARRSAIPAARNALVLLCWLVLVPMATVRISRQIWAFSPQALLGSVFSVPPAAFNATQRTNDSSPRPSTTEGNANASSSIVVELEKVSSAELTSANETAASWIAQPESSEYPDSSTELDVVGKSIGAALQQEANRTGLDSATTAAEPRESSSDADFIAWGTWAENVASVDSDVNAKVAGPSGDNSELPLEVVQVAADGSVESSSVVASERSSNTNDTDKTLASAGIDASDGSSAADPPSQHAVEPSADITSLPGKDSVGDSSDDGNDGGDLNAQMWSSDVAASQLYYTLRAMVDPAGVVAELRSSLEQDGNKEHAHAAGLEDELSSARGAMGLFEEIESHSKGASLGSGNAVISTDAGGAPTSVNGTESKSGTQKAPKMKGRGARLAALFGGDVDAGDAAAAAVAATEGPSSSSFSESGARARRRHSRISSSGGDLPYGGSRGLPRGGAGAAASAVPLSVESALVVLRLMGWVADVMSGTALCVAIVGGALVLLTLKDIFAEVHRYLLGLVARTVDILKRREEDRMARINAGRQLRALLEGYRHEHRNQQREEGQQQPEQPAEQSQGEEQERGQNQEETPDEEDSTGSPDQKHSVKAPSVCVATGNGDDTSKVGTTVAGSNTAGFRGAELNAGAGSDDGGGGAAIVEAKHSGAPDEPSVGFSNAGESAAAAGTVAEPRLKLPEAGSTSDGGLAEGSECSLCFDPITSPPMDDPKSSFKCGHLFHAECADTLRLRGPSVVQSSNSNARNCPMCGSESFYDDEAVPSPLPSIDVSDGGNSIGTNISSSSSDSHSSSSDDSEAASLINAGPAGTASNSNTANRAAAEPDSDLAADASAPTTPTVAAPSTFDSSAEGANGNDERNNPLDQEAPAPLAAPAVAPAVQPDNAPADQGGIGDVGGHGGDAGDDAHALNNINVVVGDAAAAAMGGGGGGDAWEDEAVNVDLPDAMGFGRPLGGALGRATKLLAFNAVFLVFFQLLPYQLGALLLSALTSATQGPEGAGGSGGDLASHVLGPVFGRAFLSVFGSSGDGEPPFPVHPTPSSSGPDEVPTLAAMVCGHCALLVLAITTAAVCFVLAAGQLVQARVPGGLLEASRLMARTLVAAARARWVRAQVHALVARARAAPQRRRRPAHGERAAAAGAAAGGGGGGAGARAEVVVNRAANQNALAQFDAALAANQNALAQIDAELAANRSALAQVNAEVAAARLGPPQQARALPLPPPNLPRRAAFRIVLPLGDVQPEELEVAAMALGGLPEVAAAAAAAAALGGGVAAGDVPVVAPAVAADNNASNEGEVDEAVPSDASATALPHNPGTRYEADSETASALMESGNGASNMPGKLEAVVVASNEAKEETIPQSVAVAVASPAAGTGANLDKSTGAAAFTADEVQEECFDTICYRKSAAAPETMRDDEASGSAGMAADEGEAARAELEKVETVEKGDAAIQDRQFTVEEAGLSRAAASMANGSGLNTVVGGEMAPKHPRHEGATTAGPMAATGEPKSPQEPSLTPGTDGAEDEVDKGDAENAVVKNAETDERATHGGVEVEDDDVAEENDDEEEADRRPEQLPMLPFLFPPQPRVRQPHRERRRRRERNWAWRDVATGVGRGVRGGILLWWRALAWSWRAVVNSARTLLGLWIELVAVPVGVGWLVDAATLPAVGGDWRGRIAFAIAHPTVATTLHWLAGLGAIMAASVAINEVRDLLHPLLWPKFLPDLQRAPHRRRRNHNGDEGADNDDNDEGDGQEALVARHPAAAAVGRALEMNSHGHVQLVAPLNEGDLTLLRDQADQPNNHPNNHDHNENNGQGNQGGVGLAGPVAANHEGNDALAAAERPAVAIPNEGGLPVPQAAAAAPEGQNLWRGVVHAVGQLVFFYAPLAVLLVWAPLVLGPYLVPGAEPLNLGWVNGGGNGVGGGVLGAEGGAEGAEERAAAAAQAIRQQQRQQAEVDAAMDVQLPLEQLLFHVLLPFALEKFRIRSALKRTLQGWLLRAAAWLRVEHLVVAPQELAQWVATQARAQQVWVNTRAAEEKEAAQHEALHVLSAERPAAGAAGEHGGDAPWPSPEALAFTNRLGEEAKRAVYAEERQRRLSEAMARRQPCYSGTLRQQNQPAEGASDEVAEGAVEKESRNAAAEQQHELEPARDSVVTAAEKRLAAVTAAEARARSANAADAAASTVVGLAEEVPSQSSETNSEFTAENVKFLESITRGQDSKDNNDQVGSGSLIAHGSSRSDNADEAPPELALFLAAAEVTHPKAVAQALWRLGWSLTGLEFATVEDLEGVVVVVVADANSGGGPGATAAQEVRLSAAEAKRIVDCLPATLVAARHQARRVHWREAWIRRMVLAVASMVAAVIAVCWALYVPLTLGKTAFAAVHYVSANASSHGPGAASYSFADARAHVASNGNDLHAFGLGLALTWALVRGALYLASQGSVAWRVALAHHRYKLRFRAKPPQLNPARPPAAEAPNQNAAGEGGRQEAPVGARSAVNAAAADGGAAEAAATGTANAAAAEAEAAAWREGAWGALMAVGGKWSAVLCQGLFLGVTMGILAPVLLGALFKELVVMPFYVPLDESPAANTVLQNWAVGLVFLKLWVRIMVFRGPLLEPFEGLRPRPARDGARPGGGGEQGGQRDGGNGGGGARGAGAAPLAPEDVLLAGGGPLGGPAGLLALDFQVALHRVVLPTLMALLDAWAVPRVLGRVAVPLLLPHWPAPWLLLRFAKNGMVVGGGGGGAWALDRAQEVAGVAAAQDPLVDLARARRLALPVYLGSKALWRGAKRVGGWLKGLHGVIRDERYLLGVQLNNRT